MSQDPFAAPRSVPQPNPPPWGVAATIGWTVAGLCVWAAVQIAVAVAYSTLNRDTEPSGGGMTEPDAALLAVLTIVSSPAWIAAMVFAARRRGWRAADYLALVLPTRGQLLFGFICLLPLLAAFDGLSYVTGRDVVPPFMSDTYKAAADSGSLALFFLAMVFVAPVAEEVVFRGFMFRGLCASSFGVTGTLLATSAAWALMHVQYDWFGIVQIFLIGLLFGWLRWASGSTVLTIVLHVAANFIAMIEAAIWVGWLSQGSA